MGHEFTGLDEVESRIAQAPAAPADLRARLEASLGRAAASARRRRRAALAAALCAVPLAAIVFWRPFGKSATDMAEREQHLPPVVVSLRVEAIWGPPAAEAVDIRRWIAR